MSLAADALEALSHDACYLLVLTACDKYPTTDRAVARDVAERSVEIQRIDWPATEARIASREFYASREWRDLRYQELRYYGARCQCCGRDRSRHRITIHVDHIKPRSLHPELALRLDNLQVLCEDCNLGKGNRDDTDWR